MSRLIRPRRSVLYMPASNERALEKAHTLPADGFIMDLEDSVAPNAKPAARMKLVKAIKAGGYGHRELIIRVNGLHTPWGTEDIAVVANIGADAILLPKIDSVAEVLEASTLLADSGAPDTLKLWIMAETPRAILDIDAIAGADKRLAVIVIGTSDLAKSMRIEADPERTGLLPALSHCVLAARAHGLDILDGIYGYLADASGFRKSCDQGKALGFDGKTLIHPRQIEAANEVFGVSEAQVARAHEVIAAWEAAAVDGGGIAVVNGQMIEELHADEARRVLALNTAIASPERQREPRDKE